MIFVTGANGLVGSFIVRELLKKNIRPRCLKRKTSDLSLLGDVLEQIDWVEGDLLDIPLLEQLFQGIDTIIHSAALVSFNPERFDTMLKVNVEGTANLVNIALNRNIKKFFFVSSIASLGKSKKYKIIDEKSNWEDDEGISFYAKTKYLSELEVWRGTEEGLNAIVINPTIVLGRGNWNNGSTRLFKYAYDEHIFFPPGNINYVDVRDVARITILLLEKDIQNERFILNAGNISYKIFLQKASGSFNKRSASMRANTFILGIAWRFAKLVSLLTGNEPFLTKETANASRNNLAYANEKIKNILDYTFKDIDDTISWVSGGLAKHGNNNKIKSIVTADETKI